MENWYEVSEILPHEGLVVVIQPKDKDYLLEGYYSEGYWYNLFHRKIEVEKWREKEYTTCSDIPYSQYFEAIMSIHGIIKKTREEGYGNWI